MTDIFKDTKWIWCNDNFESVNQYGLFRKIFTVENETEKTIVHCCADSRYWLYVNSQRVGFGPGRFPEDCPQYDSWDITKYIEAGKNLISFKVHGIGPVYRCTSFIPSRCCLIANISLENGSLSTDSSFKAIPDPAYIQDTPRISNHQSFFECYDAREELKGWNTLDFDDSGWGSAYEIPAEKAYLHEKITKRPIPNLTLQPKLPERIIEYGTADYKEDLTRTDLADISKNMFEVERIPGGDFEFSEQDIFPVKVTGNNNKNSCPYLIFDFGNNGSGYLSATIKGTPGTIIDFAYGEHMDNGRVNCFCQGIKFNDRLILEENSVTYQTLLPRTFQYLLIEVRGGEAEFINVKHEISTYPVKWLGNFYSGDRTILNHAWKTSAYTMQLCMEDVYMDNPRRERGGWLGDMLPQAMAAFYSFGDSRLIRHVLSLYAKSQRQDGRVIVRYPSIMGPSHPNYIASFISVLKGYTLYSGDTDFALTMWDTVEGIISWFESQRRDDGLLEVYPAVLDRNHFPENYGTIFFDWIPDRREGAVSAMNMLYCACLKEAEWLAGILGRRKRAEELGQLAEVSKNAVIKNLFDSRRGIFVNCLTENGLSNEAGCQENLLALLFNIATDKQTEQITEKLIDRDKPLPMWLEDRFSQGSIEEGIFEWNSEDLIPIGSTFFDYYAISTLFELGFECAAVKTIETHYGYMLSRGASTIWEDWAGVSTRSQGYGAGVIYQIGKYILGVEPVAAGFKKFSVLPACDCLKHA
ncbi:MAG: family 78 glycoside hydrolase catalytic domain, partial [Planctomycetota bacterium]